MLLVSFVFLVLVGVGIMAIELSGKGYLLARRPQTQKFNLDEWIEQDRAERHFWTAERLEIKKKQEVSQAKAKISFAKAEKVFWKSELTRKADENLKSITLKSIFSKEKDKRKSQGRRTGDGQHSDAYYRFMWYVKTPLIYASVVIAVASVIFANSVLPKVEYITDTRTVFVETPEQPKAEDTARIKALQKELLTASQYQKVLRKMDKQKTDAETHIVELY